MQRLWSIAAIAALSACTSGLPLEPETTADAKTVSPFARLNRGDGQKRQALSVVASDAEAKALLPNFPDLVAFLAGEGKGWTVTFDRRNGQPMLLEGPGIPWITRGGAAESASREERVEKLAATAEARARDLLVARPGLVGAVPSTELVLDRRWTGSLDDQDEQMLLTFRPQPDGVELHDARLTFVVNAGKLVQIHAERIDALRTSSQPSLAVADALSTAKLKGGVPSGAQVLDQDLKVVQLSTTSEPPGVYTGPLGGGYQQHLAYLFRFTVPGDTRTIAAWVDAKNGDLLELFDDNRYGSVTGGVYPRTIAANETLAPFVDTAVTNGTAKTTDLGSNYDYAGGTATTALAGTNMKVSDACGAPAASATAAPGNLLLGTSTGTDCSFSASGHSTRAARNAFYHLNNVRQMGQKWLGGSNARATSWFASNVAVNVNISDVCNAYWDGSSVNFFRSGSGCANTGEISDVMQHEWGHGLDSNTKSGSVGDSAKGEAVADGLAMLMTHDSCVGPGFFQSGSGGETTTCPSAVRDLALVVTKANIASVCQKSFSCTGALGYECHCESHILSGAYWRLQQLYVQRYGATEGWNQFEKGYLRAFQNTTSYTVGTAGNAYDAWMAADDDNANVSDGTPNADLIFQAFNAQGIAGTQRARNVVACAAPPAAPAVTATGGTGSIALSWGAIGGASSYSIFRSQAHVDGQGFLPLASGLTAASFTDGQVLPGASYTYQVVANAGACQSPFGAGVTASAAAGTPTNDFALTISPSSSTVAAGASTTVSVSTQVTSGSAQTITLTVSGLPAGVTGSFNPASVSAGGASTLTLTASATATAGAATYTVTGTAASGSRSATGSLSVTTSGGGGGGGVLTNGVAVTNLSGASGSQAFYTLVVPAGQATLTFKLSGGTGDADLYVKFGAQPTTTVYDCRPYLSGNTETCSFTAPAAGTWYVMLRGYTAYSGTSLVGSFAGDSTPALTNGVAVTNLSGAAASQQYWKLTVPAGKTTLTFVTSGGTGDADLYVKRGAKPTTTTYDCRPYTSGNAETCTFSSPVAADYYVMIRGYAAYSGLSLKGTYQ